VKDKPGSPIVKVLPLLYLFLKDALRKTTKMHRENTHTEKKGRPLCIYNINIQQKGREQEKEERTEEEEKRREDIYVYIYLI